MQELPERPRLGSHVQARRHVLGDVAHVILHALGQDEGSRALQIGEREWTVLRQADGTRDLEGIRVAAERAGAPTRLEHLRAFFAELAALGLLGERGAQADAPAFAPDRPITPLPGYRFRCDGSGGCCRQFDTMLFTRHDVARAYAALPELGPPERVFLPQHGVESELSAVARRGGACFYFDTNLGCRIHSVKPVACRVFPMRYLDVGAAIRVAPRPECACIFEPGDEPLSAATRGAELPREVFVPALPERARMGPDAVDAATLLAFFDAARERVERSGDDLAVLCWNLAEGVEQEGARAALGAALVEPLDVGASLRAASESAERIARAQLGWRGERDLVRLGVQWTRAALARLSPRALPSAIEPDDERLYLRAAFFTPLLAPLGAAPSVEAELRDRAVAIWIARAFDAEARSSQEAAHPLALVEALARGHGLELGGSNPRAQRSMEGP